MGKRYAVLAVAQGLILVLAFDSLQSESATVLDVFYWLFVVLVAAGVGLWPAVGRAERAELALERMSWADRIEFSGPHPPAEAATLPFR